MARYTRLEGSSALSLPWYINRIEMVASASANLIVLLNEDGTETRLTSFAGDLIYDSGTDTLTGSVNELTRTNSGGTTIYEQITGFSVPASSMYSAPSGELVAAWIIEPALTGDDFVSGWSGSDFLSGFTGNDVLDGGTGGDVIAGGSGDDIYILRASDGGTSSEPDGIFESVDEGMDTIRIVGLSPADVHLIATFNIGLGLSLKGPDGSITYADMPYVGSVAGSDVGQRIERVVFDDGTIWDLTGALSIDGTDGDDQLRGTPFDDTLSGFEGDDFLGGGSGADVLHGGEGDDRLIGDISPEGGNDELDGGTGNDTMAGGAGNDIYVLRSADGGSSDQPDVIFENVGAGTDTIRIVGLSPTDVRIMVTPISGTDVLRFCLKDSEGSFTYTDVFASGDADGSDVGQRVEQVNFDDGTIWDLTGGLSLLGSDAIEVMKATRFADSLVGGSGNDFLYGGAENDTLDGGQGDDRLEGGKGDDFLSDTWGDNVLRGGAGDDQLTNDGSGSGVLEGGAGSDFLTGGTGSDVLDGGSGSDRMEGVFGHDTYVLRAGDGGTSDLPDIITPHASDGTDTIRIVGLSPADVRITPSPNNEGYLRLALKSADGSVTYTDAVMGMENFGNVQPGIQHLGKVVFDDGTIWDLSKGEPQGAFPMLAEDIYLGEADQVLHVDAAHGVLANDTAPAGGELSASLIPDYGRLRGELQMNGDGSFSYTPHSGVTGVDLLYYCASETFNDMAQIVIGVGNHAPEAVNDSGRITAFNTPAFFVSTELSDNDNDTDHDFLIPVSVSDATHGTVHIENNNVTFTAAGNYSGPASFNYTVTDGLLTSTALVQFTIAAPDKVVIGGPGDELLAGAAGNDRLAGGDGSDTLLGGAGNDWLSGGSGGDSLDGGVGGDVMWGAAGDDIYYVDDAKDYATDDILDIVIEGKNGGIDEIHSSVDYILGGYIENLVLVGQTNGTGNKIANHLTGSDDANTLNGMIGLDRLEGGGGDDRLAGGRDCDTFVFKPGFGHDTITDFAVTGAYSVIGPNYDILEFDSNIFADAEALFAHSLDTPGGVLVTAEAADTLLIANATLQMLKAHPEDFHFV